MRPGVFYRRALLRGTLGGRQLTLPIAVSGGGDGDLEVLGLVHHPKGWRLERWKTRAEYWEVASC